MTLSLLTFYLLLFILCSTLCYWEPNLSKNAVRELLKDRYRGCSMLGNDILFTLTTLIYKYDIESHYESVWLDVGANRGLFSKDVADIVYNANIYSFEPFVPAFKSLQWKLKDYINIKLFNVAISNETQNNKSFYTEIGKENDDGFTRSSLDKIYDDYYLYQYVNTTTLNDLYLESGKKELFFVKIDTEGYDGIIIKNSLNLLKEHKIKYLYFEFNNDWQTVDPTITWQYIVKEIKNCGYNVYFETGNIVYLSDFIVDQLDISGTDGRSFCFNLLAIKRGLKFERNIMNRLCPKCGY